MLDSIMSVFVPVHREGYRFIAIFAGVTLVLFWLLPDVFGWIGVILTLVVRLLLPRSAARYPA
jgi:phosphatidylserine decarboxylase